MMASILFFSPPAAAQDSGVYFQTLEQRLIADGFDAQTIKTLYAGSAIAFDTRGLSLFLVHRESKLNYDQFSSWRSINKARGYMQAHAEDLTRTEKNFGVDKEVITAIILVETMLGRYVGNRPVINTLSSMAALADPKVRNLLWDSVSSKSQYSRDQFDDWADRKSVWAYQELKAFLKHTATEKFDPAEILGSYAGAMGIAQFMPSNILTYAKDGDGDGRIDLFDHADAIASIANYLKINGWHPGIDEKQAYQVIYSYNHSSYYVDTILKIAKLLKG
jgi:membrane-bound lytic murein transglycosylase B